MPSWILVHLAKIWGNSNYGIVSDLGNLLLSMSSQICHRLNSISHVEYVHVFQRQYFCMEMSVRSGGGVGTLLSLFWRPRDLRRQKQISGQSTGCWRRSMWWASELCFHLFWYAYIMICVYSVFYMYATITINTQQVWSWRNVELTFPQILVCSCPTKTLCVYTRPPTGECDLHDQKF